MNAKSKNYFEYLMAGLVILSGFLSLTNIFAFGDESINPDNMLFIDFSISSVDTNEINLVSDQVSIKVDGIERNILYFSRISPGAIQPDNPNSWIVANQLRGQHSIILLLDLNSLDNAALNSTRTSIRNMLEALPDNHNKKIMIATLGNQLSFVQPFTTDKTKILEGLNNVRAFSGRVDYKSLIKSISEAFSIQYNQNPTQAMEEAIREANHFLIQVNSRKETAAAGLETFAEWFTGLSGPKNVLLFSGGYPLMPSPVVQDIIRAYNEIDASRSIIPPSLLSAKLRSGGDNSVSEKIKEITAKLNRNQMSLFALDSRDVKSDGLAASGIRWLPQRVIARHNSSHITAGHEFLKTFTEPTKGILISSPKNFLDKVSASSKASYIVGIEGETGEEPGETSSKIDIEITGPDGLQINNLEMNRRDSFFSLIETSSNEALAGAFNFPLYYQDFSVSFNIRAGKGQLTTEAVLPPEALTFVKERGNFFCMLEVFGLLTDSEGNNVTGDKNYTFAKQFPIRMDETQLKNLLSRKTVSANASATGITPGKYTLTVVVRQPRTGLLSASRMDLTME